MRWIARPGGVTWLTNASGVGYIGEVKKRPQGLSDRFVWSATYRPYPYEPKDFVASDNHRSLKEAKEWLELFARLKGYR